MKCLHMEPIQNDETYVLILSQDNVDINNILYIETDQVEVKPDHPILSTTINHSDIYNQYC